MADLTELRARLTFKKKALDKLQAAYLALIGGGVKSYMIDDRQLTRFDLPVLKAQIDALESEIDELENIINGTRPRRAFGIIPRDF
jgi:hypothetical protein